MNYLVVFVTNATILIFEIAGARLLAPYMGTSTEVWAGTIAVILGGMAVGYWAGGVLADRYPSRNSLALLIFASGLAALVAWSVRDLIPTLFAGSHALPLTFSAMLTAAFLFMPTTILLAAVSPFVAKALIVGLDSSARVVGRLNAVGTLGSIIGAIATGALLVPHLGLSMIFLGIAIVLLLLSAVVATDRFRGKLAIVFIVGLFAFGFNQIPVRADSKIADVSTAYNRIWVGEQEYDGAPLRTIQIDPFSIQCGLRTKEDGSIDGTHTVFRYLRAFMVVNRTAFPDGPSDALILGGCNYSFPRTFLSIFPNANVTVVEIDPGMTKVAEEYFEFDPSEYPTLTIAHEDARQFIEQNEATYDVIFMDVFGSFANTPHHLTTKENFIAAANRLNDDGVIILNFIGTYEGPGKPFAESFLATARTVFPHAALYTINTTYAIVPQNLILVASKTRDFGETIANRVYPDMTLHRLPQDFGANGLVLTDDFAPVERLTAPIRDASF